jgi:hypothetical protein
MRGAISHAARSERAELLARLRQDAARIAAEFGLDYRAIHAENVKSRYGVCYSDGLIKVRLSHASTGRPLKYSSLIDTVCHELAHLRHFNHGPEFKAFFFELLGWARRQGIYRPGRPGAGGSADGEARRATRTERSNGVPVFPRDPAPRGDLNLLPWERWQQLLAEREGGSRRDPTRHAPRPAPRPAPVSPPPGPPPSRARPPAREQLSLF